MPLIVISGYPSSGKSTWANDLSAFFQGAGKEVLIIGEKDCLREDKNVVLDDSRKEKELRAKVKSEAQRLLTKDNVVIVDALNYIKGYRYELFCMSKAVPTRQVTIQCDISSEQAWEWNSNREDESEKYTREVFDRLIQRFELPDPQNRWDSPLFSVLPNEKLNLQEIHDSLFLKKPPKQNLSTQNKPVSESSYMYSLEKVSADIVQAILTAQKESEEIEDLTVPHAKATITLDQPVTLPQLTKLKRQFMTLTKTSNVKDDAGELFVQYLNSQLGGTS